MPKKTRFFSAIIVLLKYLFSMLYVYAVECTNFDVINTSNKSLILLSFRGIPVYSFYFLHCPERLILDVSYAVFSSYKKVPMNFNDKLVYQICVDKLIDGCGMRFVFNLVDFSDVNDIFLENVHGVNILLLVITKHVPVLFDSTSMKKKRKGCIMGSWNNVVYKKNKNPFITYLDKQPLKDITLAHQGTILFPIAVAIDAGHGGHDPGAKGYSGLYEKNITIAIAKKFKKLLDQDPLFTPIMIRDGDYFISILDRSELARKKGANVLLSIHADAISKKSKSNVRGSSVWVLSDRGASAEMTHWLANRNKWSKLSKGVSNILMSSADSPNQYFLRTILDLQFCHSQKVGYGIASYILNELKKIGVLHKHVPEYSNFAILRSLDMPSILVETGFITNSDEEKLLSSDSYQEKIARALYEGLRSYFLEYVLCVENITNTKFFSDFRCYSNFLYGS